MYLTTEKTAEIIKTYGKSANDSGSTKCQIAIFTERINALTEKMKENHKDFVTQRALLKLVGKRRNLLAYLKNHDIEEYRTLIKELNIRK
ncbi:MAG: 30S ribosomal protein S15 [Bacteroidales bacterium]|nr:30S ribosomal protein S15 [Bacteroidales bacterium]